MTKNSQRPIKIILDTDIGSDVDDAIALAFARLRPELDIRAVTTVYGPVAQRSAVTAKLLMTLGRDDIPYATGASTPLNGILPLPGTVNQFPVVQPGESLPAPAADNAQALLRRVIEANPSQVWLVAIGPLTNVALLIRDHPDLAAKLAGIALMGGEPTRPFADYNIRLDADAADIVFRSPLLKFVGTYDVTKRITMNDADCARLQQAATPAARVLLDCIRLWKPHTNKPGPIVYDMCPLTWLFAPQLFTTHRQSLAVELQPPDRRGVTLTLLDGPAAAVSTDIDVNAVHRLLMDTLTR